MGRKNRDFTVLRPVDEYIESEWGMIRYQAWCERFLKAMNNPKYIVRYTKDKHSGEKICCISK